ncbi:succinate-semialdehyde dehydrogenase/glutarate-semialdehyde dehydrogenase [Georgenia soli]|uniref:Succinate-semialdehyde dehydrogenase/glutarate-semialdehyde dehydrogenase n=1 Tax=Georgenia soli TaxID=638953 RepID=A0A2A9EP04_9MICO|nr:aldehyde dehydrogenase family protein [Georgenia soli]PFG39949.1 succinate-semialdehyde dehydrogenase/glutarate-semialdehyde dehydrogenase [Georgenia soli]
MTATADRSTAGTSVPARGAEAAGVPTTTPAARVLATHYVGGREVPAANEREIRRTSPSTGEPACVVVPATHAEVAEAVGAADAARAAWRRTPPAERAAALRRAAAAVRAAAPELGALLTATTGRLIGQAVEGAEVAADLLEEAATTGLGATGRTLAGGSSALDVVRREPRGVVAVVTPWNDPFPAAAGLLAAALVTGNTVVHKPSERSAAPGWAMARLIAEELPAGVLNIVNGDGETGAGLVLDERVALVAHVGSTAAGRRIAATAGARGARVLLENGGKDPIVVDAGVDPVWAAGQIALGAFTNTGQICTSVERVYLHESVADDVLAELVRLADDLRVGSPDDPATKLGPLVDEAQLAVVAEHVSAAVAGGARCLAGGAREDRPGCYYPATVLDGCTAEMAVMTEETFGPVAAVTRVRDFDEALRLAGTGRYGLAATVLTPYLGHALRASEELDVGTVKINAVFGGAPGGSADPRRDSGAGAGYGPDLLTAMTVLKTVHLEAAR